ncbi:MAG TPA: PadR family transcriptional regulator [Vicinamibacterales bacterium]|nr:PadR family transcriptional regulator [Vicinamibacterales bacterium]
MTQPTEILKGTLALLILRTLELEPRHGVSIADRIAQITKGTFAVKAGSLFPALHRLEQEGFIAGEWSLNDAGRRVKLYRLTTPGRQQLAAEKKQWARIVSAIGLVLDSD